MPRSRKLRICLLLLGWTPCAVVAQVSLKQAPGVDKVTQHCTICHSAAIITQSRASREGWLAMIRWMQDSQGLWPLGPDEPAILDYLEANYAPERSSRRKPLNVVFDSEQS